jgi:hypothetical protein
MAVDRSRLGQLSRIGDGQTSIVYKAPNVRLSIAKCVVFKEYKPEHRARANFDQLEKMVTFLESLNQEDGKRLVERTAWPMAIVFDGGHPCGFLMPEVPQSFFISLKVPSGSHRQSLAKVELLLNSEEFLAKREIPISDRRRFELVMEVAQTLEFFHRHRIAVGDISQNNLLISLEPNRRCFFVDSDGMAIDGRSVLPQMETDDWMVASISREPLGTSASDRYKLALLALRLFALSQETVDPNRLPGTFPPEVRRLIKGGLDPQPANRPSAREWIEPVRSAMANASKALSYAPTKRVSQTSPSVSGLGSITGFRSTTGATPSSTGGGFPRPASPGQSGKSPSSPARSEGIYGSTRMLLLLGSALVGWLFPMVGVACFVAGLVVFYPIRRWSRRYERTRTVFTILLGCLFAAAVTAWLSGMRILIPDTSNVHPLGQSWIPSSFALGIPNGSAAFDRGLATRWPWQDIAPRGIGAGMALLDSLIVARLAPTRTESKVRRSILPILVSSFVLAGLLALVGVGGAEAASSNGSPILLTDSGQVVSTNQGWALPAPADPTGSASPIGIAAAAGNGLWILYSDGHLLAAGGATSLTPNPLTPLSGTAVSFAPTPDDTGGWIAASNGSVEALGTAHYKGGVPTDLAAPIVAVRSTSDGKGYWLLGSDGGVFAFGDARYEGRPALTGVAAVGMAATPDNRGYWIATSAGSVVAFGDAQSYGPLLLLGGSRSRAIGIDSTSGGGGYWLILNDQVIPFGDAAAVSVPFKSMTGSIIATG